VAVVAAVAVVVVVVVAVVVGPTGQGHCPLKKNQIKFHLPN
jgi:hypothetical protein